MDLLDRYMNAVRLALIGRARRDDIIAEMRDDLLTRIEAREAELGRPLTHEEVEAVLKANGHPLLAAARYRERQYLIGPTILPFYEAAVAAILVLLLFITFIQVAVSPVPVRALEGAVGDYIGAALSMIGAATVVAFVLERFEVKLRFIEDWRPRDLPQIGRGPAWTGVGRRPLRGATTPQARGSFGFRPKNRWESLFELVVLLFFIAWWSGLAPWPVTGIWVAENVRVSPGAIWANVYWVVFAVAGVQALAAALRFVQPYPNRLSALADLISNLAMFGLTGALLANSGHWVEIEAAHATAEQMQKLYSTLDLVIRVVLVLAIAIGVVRAAQALWILIFPPRVESLGA